MDLDPLYVVRGKTHIVEYLLLNCLIEDSHRHSAEPAFSVVDYGTGR